MDNTGYVTIAEFCSCYQVDNSFIQSLNDYGLIQVVTIEETQFLPQEQVGEVEKMIRLHYDLEINLEGIDAVSNLLQRISDLQDEIRVLQNRLRLYED